MLTRTVNLGGTECKVCDEAAGKFTWDQVDMDRYEPELFAALEQHADPAGTFLDLGAFVGVFTLWAAARFATVVAVEPDRKAYDLLLANAFLMDPATHEQRSWPARNAAGDP